MQLNRGDRSSCSREGIEIYKRLFLGQLPACRRSVRSRRNHEANIKIDIYIWPAACTRLMQKQCPIFAYNRSIWPELEMIYDRAANGDRITKKVAKWSYGKVGVTGHRNRNDPMIASLFFLYTEITWPVEPEDIERFCRIDLIWFGRAKFWLAGKFLPRLRAREMMLKATTRPLASVQPAGRSPNDIRPHRCNPTTSFHFLPLAYQEQQQQLAYE